MTIKTLACIILALLMTACSKPEQASLETPVTPLPPTEIKRSAEFVGNTQCASCHSEQMEQWQGSHHDLAMQVASEDTVLGDFNNTVHKKDNVTTRFFRNGD
jgi:hypothetical protein